MKISELETKSYLGKDGVNTHSYIIVNYQENTNSDPVTYKVTLDELGKSIVKNNQLVKVVENQSTGLKQLMSYQENTNHNGYNNTQPLAYAITSSQNAERTLSYNESLQIVTTNNDYAPIVFYNSGEGAVGYYDSDNTWHTFSGGGGGSSNINTYVIEASGYGVVPFAYKDSLDKTPTGKLMYYDASDKLLKYIPNTLFIVESNHASNLKYVTNTGIQDVAPLEKLAYYLEQDGRHYLYCNDSESTRLDGLAYIGTSDNTPAIYDASNHYIGKLAT